MLLHWILNWFCTSGQCCDNICAYSVVSLATDCRSMNARKDFVSGGRDNREEWEKGGS
jgi:hypothetical protein